MTETPIAVVPTVTTWDGSVIPGTITTTAHRWTADASGLFHTTADLATEWATDYSAMLAGHANLLTPLQRLEGNAEAVLENTKAINLPTAKLGALREDLQREYDAIDAAMRIDQAKYGIDPGREFNSYTYLKMEDTLQSSESLQELGYQGHGTNTPIAPRYSGFTTDFQNKTDNTTYYVGGGLDNGEKAIADFLDDVMLSHAPFASVMHNGAMEQLNQNGDVEDTITDVVAGANAVTYERVLVSSDFSTNKAATGADMAVLDVRAAPDLPVAKPGQVTTLDGSVISGTISGLTPHTWVADASGLFHTQSDLAAEWATSYHLSLQGAKLTEMQRWEANAEAVLENTAASKLGAAKVEQFREDAQREFDAIAAAQAIDAKTLGISASAQFTTHSLITLERTVRFNESLEELAVQGHGLNGNVAAKYRGYTENFQNRTDNTTLYTGPGDDNGEKAIADFFDDVILTHAAFPAVLQNGKIIQLNQNGNDEDTINVAVADTDEAFYTLSLNDTDFTHPAPKATPVTTKKA